MRVWRCKGYHCNALVKGYALVQESHANSTGSQRYKWQDVGTATAAHTLQRTTPRPAPLPRTAHASVDAGSCVADCVGVHDNACGESTAELYLCQPPHTAVAVGVPAGLPGYFTFRHPLRHFHNQAPSRRALVHACCTHCHMNYHALTWAMQRTSVAASCTTCNFGSTVLPAQTGVTASPLFVTNAGQLLPRLTACVLAQHRGACLWVRA